eukprot:TRINITY_DN11755_c0_g1_i1.p1 TRINITY_DN11755_c0_g1~~TRINITY_DN11755_c0_g1_i1.p1  ORF type:complete len:995 (-),score=146.79 TRINITY_DN11755_c0_g1_i1:47-2974(-)
MPRACRPVLLYLSLCSLSLRVRAGFEATDCDNKGPWRTHGSTLLQVSHSEVASEKVMFNRSFDQDGLEQRYPSDLMTCPGGAVPTTLCMTKSQYDEISGDVQRLLRGLNGSCDEEICPQADFAGCVLRMAGHDFMDFQWGEQGGSDGCIDFEDPDNRGLEPCLVSEGFLHEGEFGGASLLTTYQKFCSIISLADFFVIAAEAVMSETRANAGSTTNFKAMFRYGRTTASECSFAQGRLPDPEVGCSATEKVFLRHLDLSWEESAALMGVHTLGRAHRQNSGYHGWWSDPGNSRKFNNNYYVSLLSKAWGARVVEEGKHQWDRVDTGAQGHESSGNEMMLNTDLCLAFSDVAAADAVKNNQCSCTWIMPNGFFDVVQAMPEKEWCGTDSLFQHEKIMENHAARVCCPSPMGSDTCDDIDQPQGIAIEHVRRFAANDTLWFEVFSSAWSAATTVGFSHQDGILLSLRDTCSAQDFEREVVTANFPSTTSTSTTTTTTSPLFVSESTISRWFFSNSMDSCTRTCQLNGKQCSLQAWHAHGHEMDSFAKMAAIVREITGLNRSNNAGSHADFDFTSDGVWLRNFTSMGGGTTVTARSIFTGSLASAKGTGSGKDGYLCARDQTPLGSESFMTPAANFMGKIGPNKTPGYECRFNKINRRYELDQCERNYHGGGWRRLCVCDAANSEADWELEPDTTACLLLGRPDPECCARPIEASCAPGFQYSTGQLCMWTHDHQYFNTECRWTGTTSTTSLPSFAEGFFLGPHGEASCHSVCAHQGLTCSAQGFRDSQAQIGSFEGVTAVIDAIGQRDWLGLSAGELVYPQCIADGGSAGYRLWPGVWGQNFDWFNCMHWQGDIPDDHCAPSNAPEAGGWRRLCKCEARMTTTVATGYTQVGSNAMCTDDAFTRWNEGIAVGEHPRSQQENLQACEERCEDTPGCNGFVYWHDVIPGHCRTYRACDQLRYQNFHEYLGSKAFRRVAS